MFSQTAHVMTLANSIIGVGILAMPFCFQKCGIVLSILLIIISSWVTRICCHYLIKSSLLTRRKSFEFLGHYAFGISGKFLVELCIVGYLLGTCITYFVVVGDLGPQIVAKMFEFEKENNDNLRTWVMVLVTIFAVIPLGMLRNVDSLSAVCTASIGFYVCLVIKIFLESEEHIIANDWWEKVEYWRPSGVLQCLPIFGMALSCQMQLFEVFESINNQSLDKLNGIVRDATSICTCVYIAVGFFGYVAFCTQEFSGNVLVYLSSSFGSDVIKIGFVLSIAFSFPLIIFPCRVSIYSFLYSKGHNDGSGYIPDKRFRIITLFIIAVTLCVALMIPSVELIIGLVGSTIGVVICVMFPALCFRRIVKKDSTERKFAQFILVGGFCLMILGTYANLNAIDEKSSGAHLEVPNALAVDNIEKPIEMSVFIKGKVENKPLATQDNSKDVIINNKIEIPPNLPNNIKEEIPSVAPPIWPVEEVHNIIIDETKDKLAVVSPIPDNNKVETANKIDPKLQLPAQEKIFNLSKSISSTFIEADKSKQQSIDKEAIKKDEEIAAEELKNNNNEKADSKKEAKAAKEELKETQKELKKTKELLERKVDELKEELAKQNKETQNLVVEKLGEVVEKVQEIERKVQQKEDQPAQNLAAENLAEIKELKKIELLEIKPEKNDKENKNLNILHVYEPLSYRTGQLIGNVKNGTKMEQRLALPLAVWINNTSQTKPNETNTAQAVIDNQNIKQKELPQNVNDDTKKVMVSEPKAEIPNDQNIQETSGKNTQEAAQPVKEDKYMPLKQLKKFADLEGKKSQNIEGAAVPITLNKVTSAPEILRPKRDSNDNISNQQKVDINILPEPKINAIITSGLTSIAGSTKLMIKDES